MGQFWFTEWKLKLYPEKSVNILKTTWDSSVQMNIIKLMHNKQRCLKLILGYPGGILWYYSDSRQLKDRFKKMHFVVILQQQQPP